MIHISRDFSRLPFFTMLAGVALLKLPVALGAQVVVPATGGAEFRYHGDTIWRVRDTTMSRTIVHGDTVRRANFVHGSLTYTATYVLKGDVAMLVDERDGTGKRANPTFELPRSSASLLAVGDFQMLESAVRSKAMSQQASRLGMPNNDAPTSPPSLEKYPFSANLNIEQHLDTVRYIRGCAAAPPVDTTTYVILATNSLRRISPMPRSFDQYMVDAVRADINSVALRRRMASMSTNNDLPKPPKWPCDMR